METRLEDLAPRTRRDGLVIREVGGEIVIYDREADTALRLNGTAAMVWTCCDGATAIGDMPAILSNKLGTTVDANVVYQALAELNTGDLLEERVNVPSTMSRRQMMAKVGVAAAVMIPVITTFGGQASTAFAASCSPTACPSGCTSCCATDVTTGRTCVAQGHPICSGSCCCGTTSTNHSNPGCILPDGTTCAICSYGGCQVNGVAVGPCTSGSCIS